MTLFGRNPPHSFYVTIRDRTLMTGNRSKGAWIWVAMAAISFASLARVQSGVENARTYANPVIKFFAAAHQADADSSARSHRVAPRSQTSTAGIGLDLLAVFFVGLVAPLALQGFRVLACQLHPPSHRAFRTSSSVPLHSSSPRSPALIWRAEFH